MSANPGMYPVSPAESSTTHPHPPLFTPHQLNFAAIFLGLAAPIFIVVNWHRMRRDDLIIPTLAVGWFFSSILLGCLSIISWVYMPQGAAYFGYLLATLLIPAAVNLGLVQWQKSTYETYIVSGGTAHEFLTFGCFTFMALGIVGGFLMQSATQTVIALILSLIVQI